MKITANEMALLKGIVNSEYQGGDTVVGYAIWSWSATDNASPKFESRKTASGTMASLVKKGLAVSSGSGDERTCWITEAGHAVVKGEVL
jgi:hypothetical protein